MPDSPHFRSGFVALAGRPSAGKSTLLNALCGHKVSIISPKPQTTRNVIRGVVNRTDFQLVFLDTPGFSGEGHFLEELCRALQKAEAILYLMDLSRPPCGVDGEEQGLLALVREALEKEPRPLIAVLNKTDLLEAEIFEQHRTAYFKLLAQYFPRKDFAGSCFEISAKKQEGLEELLQFLGGNLPPGEPLYDADIYTDQEPEFRIRELIREQALSFCGKELPYALYVEVADLEHRDDGFWVRAFLQVERETQKGILVGKGGQRIREIRKRSTRSLRREFACPVQLDLQVKVDYKWRRKSR
ncbi:MAG: GTPase Era [Spirochaetota bacterium]